MALGGGNRFVLGFAQEREVCITIDMMTAKCSLCFSLVSVR